VGNLSFDVTREELIEAFSAAGRVVDAKVPTDRETGRPRGFAFVEYESDEAAQRCIEQLNGRDLKGRPLRGMVRPLVGRDLPAVVHAGGEEAGVVAGAVVPRPEGGVAAQVGLGEADVGQHAAHEAGLRVEALVRGAHDGELLGAHIIGHEATEMIAEACAAKTSEATMHSLAETMHAHPTMAEAFHEATLDALGRAIHL